MINILHLEISDLCFGTFYLFFYLRNNHPNCFCIFLEYLYTDTLEEYNAKLYYTILKETTFE